MIYIESEFPFPNHLLEGAVHAAFDNQSVDPESELTIVLTNDTQVQELNRDYLGIDSPTDVLSFPA